jgi:3'-5' exoribonuclease
MTSILDIPALSAGDEVHHPLLVCDVVIVAGEHPRTTLMFSNCTGRIGSAPFWSGRDEMIRGLARGMLVQVVGKVTAYRESVQLEATSVRALPRGSVPLRELVPSVGAVDKYWQYLDDTRAKLTAPRLRAVIDLFYADEAFRERYEQCPGAPGTGHHASIGGLLQHTCEVLRIGQQIARVAKADEELVVAGALLHDIGKLESYAWESGVFETTTRGRLVGHVVQGVLMLQQAISRAASQPCTPEEQLLLEHFILSHHGHLEFGAAVKPLTLEAEILHFADDASAKTASINEAYALKENFPSGDGVSAKKIWQLDGRWMYRAKMDFGRNGES